MAAAGSLDRDAIVEIVNGIMVEEFECEGELTPESSLEELGLDSLDGVDLVVALEKAFSCRIPEQEAKSIRTLGDIYQRIEGQAGLAPKS